MFYQMLRNESWDQFFANADVKHCEMDNQIVRHISDTRDDNVLKTENYMRGEALKSETKSSDFHHVIKKFVNSKSVRRNADQRMFWTFNGIYVVKRFFTFGLLSPIPQWPITILNGHAEMDLYVMDQMFPLGYMLKDENDFCSRHLNTNQMFRHGYLPNDETDFCLRYLDPGERIVLDKPFILIAKRICMFHIKCNELEMSV